MAKHSSMIPATAFPKTRGVWANRCAVEVDVTAELDEMIQEIPSPMRQRRLKKDGLEGDCSLAPVQLEADSLASASPISDSDTQRCYSKMTMLSLYEPSPKKITFIGAPPGLSLPDGLKAQKEMDMLLQETFFDAMKKAAGDLPTPIKGTYLYTHYMRPCRPAGTSLEVKESSFKSLKGFLAQLEQDGFLSLSGHSDPVVTKIHWSEPKLNAFLLTSDTSPQSKAGGKATALKKSLLQGVNLQPSWRVPAGLPSKASGISDETQTPSSSGSELTAEETPSCFPDSGSDFASVFEEDYPIEPSEPMKVYLKKTHQLQMFTGDFLVATAWSSDETWEDEIALSVQQDELVYVSCVDAQGWAKAVAISGQGWLPAEVLRRQVYTVMADYSGGPGYVKVEQGDQLTIYHREGEWAYGAVIGHSQALEEGWFPCSVVNAQSS